MLLFHEDVVEEKLCVSTYPVVFYVGFQMFGIVFGLSDAILGLTLLAWGNSIGGKSSVLIFFSVNLLDKLNDQVRPNIMVLFSK